MSQQVEKYNSHPRNRGKIDNLVELPEEKEVTDSKGDTEMKTYGAYYVPAVESRYISNMPVYDGTFN